MACNAIRNEQYRRHFEKELKEDKSDSEGEVSLLRSYLDYTRLQANTDELSETDKLKQLEISTCSKNWTRHAANKKNYLKILKQLALYQDDKISLEKLQDFIRDKLGTINYLCCEEPLPFDDLMTVEHRELVSVCASISKQAGEKWTPDSTEAVLKTQLLMAALTQNVEQILDAVRTLVRRLKSDFESAKPLTQEKFSKALAPLNLGAEFAAMTLDEELLPRNEVIATFYDKNEFFFQESSEITEAPVDAAHKEAHKKEVDDALRYLEDADFVVFVNGQYYLKYGMTLFSFKSLQKWYKLKSMDLTKAPEQVKLLFPRMDQGYQIYEAETKFIPEHSQEQVQKVFEQFTTGGSTFTLYERAYPYIAQCICQEGLTKSTTIELGTKEDLSSFRKGTFRVDTKKALAYLVTKEEKQEDDAGVIRVDRALFLNVYDLQHGAHKRLVAKLRFDIQNWPKQVVHIANDEYVLIDVQKGVSFSRCRLAVPEATPNNFGTSLTESAHDLKRACQQGEYQLKLNAIQWLSCLTKMLVSKRPGQQEVLKPHSVKGCNSRKAEGFFTDGSGSGGYGMTFSKVEIIAEDKKVVLLGEDKFGSFKSTLTIEGDSFQGEKFYKADHKFDWTGKCAYLYSKVACCQLHQLTQLTGHWEYSNKYSIGSKDQRVVCIKIDEPEQKPLVAEFTDSKPAFFDGLHPFIEAFRVSQSEDCYTKMTCLFEEFQELLRSCEEYSSLLRSKFDMQNNHEMISLHLQEVGQSACNVFKLFVAHRALLKRSKDVSFSEVVSSDKQPRLMGTALGMISLLDSAIDSSNILKFLNHLQVPEEILLSLLQEQHAESKQISKVGSMLLIRYFKEKANKAEAFVSIICPALWFNIGNDNRNTLDDFLMQLLDKTIAEQEDKVAIEVRDFFDMLASHACEQASLNDVTYEIYSSLLKKCFDQTKSDTQYGASMVKILLTPIALFNLENEQNDQEEIEKQVSNLLEMFALYFKKTESGSVKAAIQKAIGCLVSRLLKVIQNPDVDRHSEEIVQSSLLSGGIEEANLHMLSMESLARIQGILEHALDPSLAEAFKAAMKQSEDQSIFDEEDNSQVCRSIIHAGKSKACDSFLEKLHEILCGKRAFLRGMTQEGGSIVTRAAFAIMVKFTDLAGRFEELLDEVQMELDYTTDSNELEMREARVKDIVQQNAEQFLHLWENANKMRFWLAEKKQILTERVENQRKQEAESAVTQINTQNDEDVVVAEISSIVTKIVEKAEFLIKLKTPEIFESSKSQDITKLPHLVKQPTYMSTDHSQESQANQDDWREKVHNWKQEIEERNLTKQELKDSAVSTGIQQIIAILQMPVTVNSIRRKVELNILNACRRYSGLQLIDLVLSSETDSDSYFQLLSAFCSLQKDQRELSHYMDNIKGCGIVIESKLRDVFFRIIAKLIDCHKKISLKDREMPLQFLDWNFLARDFGHLYHQIGLFKLFFKSDLELEDFKTDIKHFTSKRKTFEDLFLAVLSRITQDEDKQVSQTSTFKQELQRAKSVVDEDSSELLMSQAFNEIFRLFDWFNKASAQPQAEQTAIVEEEKEAPKNDDGPESEGIVISPLFTGIETQKDEENKKPETPIVQVVEKEITGNLLYLIQLFINAAQKVPRVLKMLHRVVANPFHLRTLFELMLSVVPLMQIKILRIVQSLFNTQLPLIVFDEAILAVQCPKMKTILNEGQYLVLSQKLEASSTSGRVLVQFLHSYAFMLRFTDKLPKDEWNYDLSAFLIRTVKKVFLSQLPATKPSVLEDAFFSIAKADYGEQELLFEVLDASMFTTTEGAKVRLMKQIRQQSMKFDQEFEIIAYKKKEKKSPTVQCYDPVQQKMVQLKQADLQHREHNAIVDLLDDELFTELQEIVISSNCSRGLRCLILKLFAKNEHRLKPNASLIAFLKANAFEGNTELASDIYMIGFHTFCFYQPILFEEAIALSRKLSANHAKSEIEKPLKIKKIRASRITYKDGKPIARIIDGPDTELKPLPQENVRKACKQTLIKNYYRVAKQARKELKMTKDMYYDSADLWLLFNKIGFSLYEKNQRFESTNLSIPVKVVYALLSYDDDSKLRTDMNERTQFLSRLKAMFMDKSNDYSERYKHYIMHQLTGRLKATLEKQSSDEEVIKKVQAIDFSEVDACFVTMLENCDVRMKFFAKNISSRLFGARSDYAYYSIIRKSRFDKAITSLAHPRRKKIESRMMQMIRTHNIAVYRLLAGALCSTLLFSLYNPRDDPDFDVQTLDKLMQHYHFLKKNKNVNLQEYIWSDKPRYFYSSRYHDMLMQASKAKPDMVCKMLQTQAAIFKTYLFEACVRSNAMVQAQVFSHHMIGILRLIAAEDDLFKQHAAAYMPIILKEIMVLTFQAEEANKDYDDEFGHYSRMLARKVFDSLIVFALKVKQHALEFSADGRLESILSSPELQWINEHLTKIVGNFHQYRKALRKDNFNIFSFLMLEVLTILSEAHSIATQQGHPLRPLGFAQLLVAYNLVKTVFYDKKDSFVTINRIHESQGKSPEPEWTQIQAGEGWTKLDLSGNRKSIIELSLTDASDQQYFVNRTVAVSEKPEVNSKTKFYKVIAAKPVKFKSKAQELYVKFLSGERFLSQLEGKEKVTEYTISESEFGAAPCMLFNHIKPPSGKYMSYYHKENTCHQLVVADNGRRLFMVWRMQGEIAHQEIKFQKDFPNERIKWISQRQDASLLIAWQSNLGVENNGNGTRNLVSVLMHSGRMLALDVTDLQDRVKRNHHWLWDEYPLLPGDRRINSVSFVDKQMLAVSKDCKIFGFQFQILDYRTNSCRNIQSQCNSVQRYGATIVKFIQAWFYQTTNKSNAVLVSCETTSGPAVCSNWDPVKNCLNDLNQYKLLQYESDMTRFVKIDVNHGLGMAIDQDGEVWALCGKQSKSLNAGLPSLIINGKEKRRKLQFPVKTSLMTKLGAKALDLQIGVKQTYILAQNNQGQKFVHFIGFENPASGDKSGLLQKHFSPGFTERYDLIAFNDGANSLNSQHDMCLILRNKADPAKLQIRYRSADPTFKLAESEPKKYSETAQTLFKALMDSQKPRKKQYDDEQQCWRESIRYFKNLNTIGDKDSIIPPEVVSEVTEIRQNYFNVYDFLIKVMQLARIAAEDIYFGRKYLSHQVPEDLIGVDVTQKMVDRFTGMLSEFENNVIMPMIMYIKFLKCDSLDDGSGNGQVAIDRIAADEFKSQGVQEQPNQFKTIFSQMFNNLDPKNFITMSEYAFRVTLKREGAYDAGGPRREVTSNFCSELMSPVLSILTPTGNNLANYGGFTQCYTLNPNATHQLELKRIQYLGYILGWSINSRQGLGLDLAPHIWKRIIHGASVAMTMDDLNKVDARQTEMLKHMQLCKDMSDSEFDELYPDQFMVSDFGFGRVVELCEGGSKIKLTRDNVEIFADLFVKKYFEQDRLQFEAFFQGIEAVCGRLTLKMLNEEMIETRACSSKQVSWQAMKRQFKFDCERSVKEKFLWCIKEMTSLDRQKLLKFMSGATRLIPNENYYVNDQHVEEYKIDQIFPEGHTCGFTIDVANYSTKEVMLSQIRKAIALCGEIDADNNYLNSDGESNEDRNSYESFTDNSGDYGNEGAGPEDSNGDRGENSDESGDSSDMGEGEMDDGEDHMNESSGYGSEEGSSDLGEGDDSDHFSNSDSSSSGSGSGSSSHSSGRYEIEVEMHLRNDDDEEEKAGSGSGDWESVEEQSLHSSQDNGDSDHKSEASDSGSEPSKKIDNASSVSYEKSGKGSENKNTKEETKTDDPSKGPQNLPAFKESSIFKP